MEMLINMVIVLLIIGCSVFLADNIRDVRNTLYDKISFRETMDLCELPIITFVNNEIKLNFILDTGANASVINREILPKLSCEKSQKQGNIYGLEGKRQSVDFITMGISYKNKEFKEEFQVLDMNPIFNNLKADYGINVHGILSSTFFQKYKYVLNFDELIAYSKI